MVRRIYVEKRPGTDFEAMGILADLRDNFLIDSLEQVRIIKRYDIAGVDDETYQKARKTIFSEPQVDECFDERVEIDPASTVIAMEFLPGQYDQRADSAAQCIQILTAGDKPIVRVAKLVVLDGKLSEDQVEIIKSYLINPVEAQLASLDKPQTLDMDLPVPADIGEVAGFVDMDEAALTQMLIQMGFAMDLQDLKFCQDYFRSEKRNPTLTEMRMIDTYWSDHCRHTTFLTKLTAVDIAEPAVKEVFDEYLAAREKLYVGRDKDLCLMDLATIGAKELKRMGLLDKLDESEEINACSIKVKAVVGGVEEDWLVMFKNETHNHPTEIEPFGGAATCLGGAIRDPLSGRSYVYQAMRITGAADPTGPVADTLPGKLPQKKITLGAAQGYSSYGNQIGLATGIVQEIYHPGYMAKRMELGAVIAAAPAKNVVRERPQPGDIVVLLGGKTGRDGCGGATGSSKAHTSESLSTCGAEVQKGNALEERKIQRLMRNEKVTTMIKRCNDFGAGGVSVAIGELADGLAINLDLVPKKYDGLDGTELAISESQERMAVVIRKEDEARFIRYANEENLEATVVATVTEKPNLVMYWRGKKIVDLTREFINTNGATKESTASIPAFSGLDRLAHTVTRHGGNMAQQWCSMLADLNVCSQKGLVERFDSTVGAGTVFMPYGGRYQLTPSQSMVATLPVAHGDTYTGTVMAHGYNPVIASRSPFHGAVDAVVESVTKAVCASADYRKCYLTMQEYFEKPGDKPERWGKPLAALLGAYLAQKRLGIAAIGGKDSMSGSFNDLDVPPTLVCFAVSDIDVRHAVSNELKQPGDDVYLLRAPRDDKGIVDFEQLKKNYDTYRELVLAGKVKSAYALGFGGIAEAIAKMSFGNRIGFTFAGGKEDLFTTAYGSILIESDQPLSADCLTLLGKTTADATITLGKESVAIDALLAAWTKPLEKVFPTRVKMAEKTLPSIQSTLPRIAFAKEKFAAPRVFIPAFPGTNGEYDAAIAFSKAGAVPVPFVFRNLNSAAITESVTQMADLIKNSQMIFIPGGFSGGDEPDGSGKFIATVFRSPAVKEAVMALIQHRDGLMLGICNGFQALIKLGLVPYGEIRDMDESCPTLTYNRIGRHISCMVNTKICANRSPWLAGTEVGDVHAVAVSHGEGRFSASAEMIEALVKNGQVATQYVDDKGNPTMDIRFNTNGSDLAIEGITSADGRILGKMGHSERKGIYPYINVPGEKDQKIFASGVAYFK